MPRGPVAVLVAACALAAPATASADPRDVARDYLNAHPDKFGVTSADVADVFVMSSYTTSGTGVTHVNVNQRHQGLEVFGGHATINVGPDGQVIFTGGRLVPIGAGGSAAPRIQAGQAVESAARSLKLGNATKLRVLRRDETRSRKTVLSAPSISDAPIGAQLGWWPQNGGVRLAWHSVIDDTDGEDAHLWSTTVDANTGAVLNTDDWTSHDNAKELGQRLDRQDAAAQRTPAFQQPFAAISPPNPVLDGSAYRVFAWPNESPNDAGRTLVANPADSVGVAARLARHRRLRGRGLHDHPGQQRQRVHGPGLQQRAGLPVGAVRRLIAAVRLPARPDPARAGLPGRGRREPLLLQQHDPRRPLPLRVRRRLGQLPGEQLRPWRHRRRPVRAEAADGNGTNNANFSTPAADGGAPRMQMYLWPGNQLGAQNQVVIEGGATYGASWARFTPPATPAGLPGRTLVYGGTGCTESLYPASRPGENWIAVVDGGTTAVLVPAAGRDRPVAERRRRRRRAQRAPARRRRSSPA